LTRRIAYVLILPVLFENPCGSLEELVYQELHFHGLVLGEVDVKPIYFGDVHCKQHCHELSIWAQAQPLIWIFLLMGSFTATQAQTKTRKAQMVL